MCFLDKATGQLPLFVYGTFRRGEQNYALLRGHTAEELPARVVGMSLYSLDTYPIAVPGKHTLVGELMALSPSLYHQLLVDLDRIEGCAPDREDGMFRRVTCQVDTQTQSTVKAWIYLGNPVYLQGEHRLIPHGDWVRYRRGVMQRTRFAWYLANGDGDVRITTSPPL